MSLVNSISSLPTSISQLKDVEKTDDDGNLQIYSYTYCDNNSPAELKQCRGLVFNEDNLLFSSLGFTPEYTTDMSYFSSLSLPFSSYNFFPSEEGTLIRLFFHDKWYVSTHRKLNAFNSRWGSTKSFGEFFVDYIKDHGWTSIEHLTGCLDTNHVYFFLIRTNSETKIVSNPTETNRSYFVGCMVDGKNFSLSCPHPLDFPTQKKLEFNNWEEVFSYVDNCDHTKQQGVIAFLSSDSESKYPNQFKIVNPKYQLYSQVRGNEPNLFYRYLQVRSNPVYSKLIYEIYPEHISTFILYENIIIKIAKNIHNAYISRFVNKNFVVVSKEEYKVVQECHGWHISNRSNRVTLNHVIGVLNQDKYSHILYILIKRYLSTSQ
jgi:hypothetical protein